MMQLSSKNDDSALCYDVNITHQNLKIDKFDDFKPGYLRTRAGSTGFMECPDFLVIRCTVSI